MQRSTRRLSFTLAMIAGLCTGCAGTTEGGLDELRSVAEAVIGGDSTGISESEISNALKQALTIGTGNVVSQLGQQGGFSGDSVVRIPLPNALQEAQDIAGKFGLAGMFDDLELKLNRAAEEATPKAKSLFVGAIRSMTLSDARGILNGPDDAATSYFREKTGDQLAAEMRPIVDNALSQVGAVRSFNQLLSRYQAIPGLPALDADLTTHVVEKAEAGIFHYVADEERAIRENPAKRTTELLKRVFGSAAGDA